MNNRSPNLPVFIYTDGLFFDKNYLNHCFDLLQPGPPSYFYKISSGTAGWHPFLNLSNHQHKDSAKNADIFP
jgi:hypothetical protein